MRVKVEWTDKNGVPLIKRESPELDIGNSLVVGITPRVSVKGDTMTDAALNQMADLINDKITHVKFTFLE
jgi:hypothetical protein